MISIKKEDNFFKMYNKYQKITVTFQDSKNSTINTILNLAKNTKKNKTSK